MLTLGHKLSEIYSLYIDKDWNISQYNINLHFLKNNIYLLCIGNKEQTLNGHFTTVIYLIKVHSKIGCLDSCPTFYSFYKHFTIWLFTNITTMSICWRVPLNSMKYISTVKQHTCLIIITTAAFYSSASICLCFFSLWLYSFVSNIMPFLAV